MKKNINLDFIQKIFKKAINNKLKLSPNSRFEQVPGWDSLGHMKIISVIEKELKTTFDIEEIIGVNTVKKLIILIKKKS